jgi:hypothetical protein
MTAVLSLADLASNSLAKAAVWFAVIFVLAAMGLVVVRKWRDSAADDTPDAHELLTKFREVHDRGGLSDDEYRTIKTKLAGQVQGQLEGQLSSNEKTS